MKPPTPTEPTRRGNDDRALVSALGRAVRLARGDEMSQPELAMRTGIDQPTLSKLERGVRLTVLNIWEMLTIERATGRPPGWILRQAGIIAPSTSVADAVRSDPDLTTEARRILLAAHRAATGMGEPELPAATPAEPKPAKAPKPVPVGAGKRRK